MVIVHLVYILFLIGKKTRAMLRKSILVDKVLDLRTKHNSTEISQLASATYNNLKVIMLICLNYVVTNFLTRRRTKNIPNIIHSSLFLFLFNPFSLERVRSILKINKVCVLC